MLAASIFSFTQIFYGFKEKLNLFSHIEIVVCKINVFIADNAKILLSCK